MGRKWGKKVEERKRTECSSTEHFRSERSGTEQGGEKVGQKFWSSWVQPCNMHLCSMAPPAAVHNSPHSGGKTWWGSSDSTGRCRNSWTEWTTLMNRFKTRCEMRLKVKWWITGSKYGLLITIRKQPLKSPLEPRDYIIYIYIISFSKQ